MKGKYFWLTVFALGVLGGVTVQAVAADEPVVEQPIPDANPYSGDKQKIEKGKRYFRQNTCTACHGGRADGQGDMGSGADLRKLRIGFKGFVQTVKSGRKVDGRQQFMPAFGHLSNDELFHIAAYLETLAHPEANWK